MKVSVVVVALNEGYYLLRTIQQLLTTLPHGSEILVVDDGSIDGSMNLLADFDSSIQILRVRGLGVAKARNWGAMNTSNKIIIFFDAHMEVQPGWWIPLVEGLTNPTVGAVSPVVSILGQSDKKGYGLRFREPSLSVEWLPKQQGTPYRVPLLPGCCIALRRDTFQAIGGFDGGMIRWGAIDCELSLRLWLLGYELWLLPHVEVAHLFRERHPYRVEWIWVIHNWLRLIFTHCNVSRVACVVEVLKGNSSFSSAFGMVLGSDVWARRASLAARRVRDDDWFFRSINP